MKTPIHVTKNMSGKMENMQSISTSCKCNALCAARKDNEKTVCHKCYADAQLNRYKNNQKCFADNTELLTGLVLPNELLPILNCAYFRFEAFGDLNNETQVINYFNICKKNPNTSFALWTKNPWFIKSAIDNGHDKPENLNIIFSSIFLNQVNDAVANYYTFIDKVFTVYDKEHADNVEVNCGDRKCIECLRCYKKHTGPLEYVNEKLK